MSVKSIADDKELMGRGGAVDKNMKRQPLRITEQPHQHRAADDTPCYDCGQYIARGEPFVLSALDCSKGMQAKSFRYSVHQACYDIVGQVVAILGKDATHGMEGRPGLREMWAASGKQIKAADVELARMLESAFGK